VEDYRKIVHAAGVSFMESPMFVKRDATWWTESTIQDICHIQCGRKHTSCV